MGRRDGEEERETGLLLVAECRGKKKSRLIFVSNAFPSTYGPCFLAYIAPNLGVDP